jgi:opine dehydrogenase
MRDRPVAAVLGPGTAVIGKTTTFGGLGLAGYLASKGYAVRLWVPPMLGDRYARWLDPIRRAGGMDVKGWWSGRLELERIDSDVETVVAGASLLAMSGTPELHREIARAVAPYLEPGQVVLLAPSRSGGALEFRAGLVEAKARHLDQVDISETISYIVNSRLVGPTEMQLLPEKQRLPFAALPASRTQAAMEKLSNLPFVAAPDVLSTSLTNFGPTNHAAPLLFNAGWVEHRPSEFLHYVDGCSPSVSRAIARLDAERVGLAEALGTSTITLMEYLVDSCGATGNEVYEAIRSGPMYRDLKAPDTLEHPFLVEDVTSGVVPMAALGRAIGYPMPIMESIATLASALLGRDLEAEGRGLKRMGLEGLDLARIRQHVRGD